MLRRLDVIWLAGCAALAVVMVVVWPREYVDGRPACSGVPKLTYPHRNTCYGDELPTGWVLTHPSDLALVVLGVIVSVTLVWLLFRSRRRDARVTIPHADIRQR
jgi:hypothetical protein